MAAAAVILSFDCETAGIPVRGLPLWDAAQPHLVQLGAVLLTADGEEIDHMELIVRPEGWTIPQEVANIHGITTERALAEGLPLEIVLEVFADMLDKATECRVAFNLAFDSAILTIARLRAKREPFGGPVRAVCAMLAATPVLNLPPTEKQRAVGFKVKRPSLREAHEGLLGCGFDGAHSALADARACGRVYLKLKEMGKI